MKATQLLGIAVIGAVGAIGGVFGNTAQQLVGQHLHLGALIPGGGSPTSAAAAPSGPQSSGCSSGWTQLGLADMGGFPVETDQHGTIRQTCSQGGKNSYGINAVFQVLGNDGAPTGQHVQYVGGCQFVDATNHDISVSVAGC